MDSNIQSTEEKCVLPLDLGLGCQVLSELQLFKQESYIDNIRLRRLGLTDQRRS